MAQHRKKKPGVLERLKPGPNVPIVDVLNDETGEIQPPPEEDIIAALEGRKTIRAGDQIVVSGPVPNAARHAYDQAVETGHLVFIEEERVFFAYNLHQLREKQPVFCLGRNPEALEQLDDVIEEDLISLRVSPGLAQSFNDLALRSAFAIGIEFTSWIELSPATLAFNFVNDAQVKAIIELLRPLLGHELMAASKDEDDWEEDEDSNLDEDVPF